MPCLEGNLMYLHYEDLSINVYYVKGEMSKLHKEKHGSKDESLKLP